MNEMIVLVPRKDVPLIAAFMHTKEFGVALY